MHVLKGKRLRYPRVGNEAQVRTTECNGALSDTLSVDLMPLRLSLLQGAEVNVPELTTDAHFHLFLSHVWGTGQDQMRIVKIRLLEMVCGRVHRTREQRVSQLAGSTKADARAWWGLAHHRCPIYASSLVSGGA
jgi:hypothetical protein